MMKWPRVIKNGYDVTLYSVSVYGSEIKMGSILQFWLSIVAALSDCIHPLINGVD